LRERRSESDPQIFGVSGIAQLQKTPTRDLRPLDATIIEEPSLALRVRVE